MDDHYSDLPASPRPQDPFRVSSQTLESFFIARRHEFEGYAFLLARGDTYIAEEALGHAIEVCVRRQRTHGTLCPDDREPVPWIKTIIARRVIDGQRRHMRLLRCLPSLANRTHAADAAEEAMTAMLNGQVYAFLATLPHKHHVVAVLTWVVGLNAAEIEREVGIKRSTVTTIRQRVIVKLRRQLGAERDIRAVLNEEEEGVS